MLVGNKCDLDRNISIIDLKGKPCSRGKDHIDIGLERKVSCEEIQKVSCVSILNLIASFHIYEIAHMVHIVN